MAPIKAVLRSKLDKEDTAKSLMELVDKYELFSRLSGPSSPDSFSDEDQASDSEADTWGQAFGQTQTTFQMPRLGTATPSYAAECDSAIGLHRLQFQLLSQYLHQQLQQRQTAAFSHQLALADEQPLNLSFHKPMKRPAVEEDEDSSCAASEVKRPCLAEAPAAVPASVQRRRKRSYRLSDNEEIRSYQASAPELFAWGGHKPMIHQFLLKLLNNPSCSGLIRWLNQDAGLFKVLLPGSVARLWQFIKGNRTDNYECFARGIRHSRDIGKYFEAHDYRKKKVYKFSEKALRPQSASDKTEEPVQHQSHPEQPLQPLLKLDDQQQLGGSARSSTDVLAKLKSALVERQQQQQQQQLQPKQEAVTVKEELEDEESSLVIADCDY